MDRTRYFLFGSFRLDVRDERLCDRERVVRLGHKALVVLERLVSCPGELVTKADLLATVWPDTAVSEAVLTTAIRELRQTLGDSARAPRFIETAHGRGYRFIARVTQTNRPSKLTPPTAADATGASHVDHRFRVVGRAWEFRRLHEWYAAAGVGTRRVGFIAGEAGIGKTALVEAFVSEIASPGPVRVSRGQCIEQYGTGEAYLPILEALERLGREDASIANVLRARAPNWLVHLPSLVSRAHGGEVSPVSRERMLRELASTLEALTTRDPLLLVLEDLHWSDTATLEALDYLARRRDPARLLMLVTYRPIEAAVHQRPLRKLVAELRSHPQCGEVVLDHISRDAVKTYLLNRWGRIPRIDDLADVLHHRTGGHPLFLATVVDEWAASQSVKDGADGATNARLRVIANAIPEGVRRHIEYRFDELPARGRYMLEAASVAGDPFSVAAIAAATRLSMEQVDGQCAAWSRDGRFVGEDTAIAWPNGTTTSGYRFRHALFAEVIYTRTPRERRAHLHRRIGVRLERAYGKHARSIAAQLAMHFEHGRDLRRAVRYLEHAARNALARSAYAEARQHATHGLDVVNGFTEGRARREQESTLCLLLGHVLMTTEGWGADEVARVFERARKLCDRLGHEARRLEALYGLIAVSCVRAELRRTQVFAREVLAITGKRRDGLYRLMANMELGGTALALGDGSAACRFFREAAMLDRPEQHRSLVTCFGVDMGVFSRLWGAHALWYTGEVRAAKAQCDQALDRARKLSHPFSYTVALAYTAMLYQFFRDADHVDSLTAEAIALCGEHGFPYYLAWAEVLRGWSDSVQRRRGEGIAEIRRALGVVEATGGLRLSYYRALLAESCWRHGRIDEALDVIAAGFADVERTQERWWEPELHRLRGELLWSQSTLAWADAEACFRSAIDVARRQDAKMLELRAAVSLARLWRHRRRQAEARELLARTCDALRESPEIDDLRDAHSLLKELRV